MASSRLVRAVLLVLAFPALATAQSIGGTVTDSTGAVIPGVTVEARSPALIEQVRTVVSDGAGKYAIVQLPPGVYTVTFSLEGFTTFVREDITLTTGFAADVNAQLKVGAIGETITVAGISPIVDVQNVAQQRVATREVIDTVPVGRNFQSLGVLIPGVVTAGQTGTTPQDVAGQSGNNHMNLAIHGSRSSDQHMFVDGMSVEVFTRADGSAMWFPDANYQEYVFDYSGNPPEVETGGVRVNMIPREGGNRFTGGVFFNMAPIGLQGDNLDDALRAAGLADVNRAEELWTVNGRLGGPLKRDRLWFVATHSRMAADTYEANTYYNQDVRARLYVPDRSRQGVREGHAYQTSARLTWQATPRNKFGAYLMNGRQCHCLFLIGGRGTINQPEATSNALFHDRLFEGTWMSPVTSRLLIEAAVGSAPQVYDWNQQDFAAADLAGVFDQAGINYRNKIQQQIHHYAQSIKTYRGSVSYVTGTHTAKFGFGIIAGTQTNNYDDIHGPMLSLRTLRGVPNAVTYYAYPQKISETLNPNLGLYAQDRLRVGNLSADFGVRLDIFRNSFPDQSQLPSRNVPVARSIPGQTVVSWRDLSPRLGAAYDLSGNGKTALKVGANAYVLRRGVDWAVATNPARNNASVTRQWTDLNNNFFPDGNPTNPAANGEIGPSTNLNFGLPTVSTRLDDDFAFGFGKRPQNWEFSASIQHELRPGFAVNGAYFRRIFRRFTVSDNELVGPADYNPFCVTVPTDARLPGGGGNRICDLFDLNPSKLGQIRNLTTQASKFGKQSEHWNGFDFTANTRMDKLLLQGGLSTGKTTTNNCDVIANVDNPSPLYCDRETPFLTQIKLLGAYTLPYDIQLSGTLQSIPGPEIQANVVFSNAQIAPSLGRNLAGAANVTVNVVEPGTMYGARYNQLDLRVTKILRFQGQRSARLMLDLYNALNDNTVLAYQNTFVPNWLQPLATMPPRLLKVGIQLEF